MPQLLLISSDPHIIETVQSLSEYAVLLVPEITVENHTEVLAKMADVVIALVDTAAVQDVNFYEQIGESWRYGVPDIPTLLLANEDELDNLNAVLKKPLVDFLTKPFSATLLKHRIVQSLGQQKQEAKAIAQYVTNLRHDLLAVFTPVTVYTELVRHLIEKGDFEQENLLSLINEIHRFGTHTWQMLEWYRFLALMNADNLWVSRETSSLKSLLQKSIFIFERHIEYSDQQLILDIPDELPFVKCDSTSLGIVFYELINNAYKHTAQKNIVIRVNQKDNVILVTVQIDGLHDARYWSDVFDNPHGLNLTRHIIEKHGGRIWIENELNKGTTVHFTLPVADNTPG